MIFWRKSAEKNSGKRSRRAGIHIPRPLRRVRPLCPASPLRRPVRVPRSSRHRRMLPPDASRRALPPRGSRREPLIMRRAPTAAGQERRRRHLLRQGRAAHRNRDRRRPIRQGRCAARSSARRMVDTLPPAGALRHPGVRPTQPPRRGRLTARGSVFVLPSRPRQNPSSRSGRKQADRSLAVRKNRFSSIFRSTMGLPPAHPAPLTQPAWISRSPNAGRKRLIPHRRWNRRFHPNVPAAPAGSAPKASSSPNGRTAMPNRSAMNRRRHPTMILLPLPMPPMSQRTSSRSGSA